MIACPKDYPKWSVRCSTRTLTGMIKPDWTPARIAAWFLRRDVEKSGDGYQIFGRRTSSLVARLRSIPGSDRFALFHRSNAKGPRAAFRNNSRRQLLIENAHESA